MLRFSKCLLLSKLLIVCSIIFLIILDIFIFTVFAEIENPIKLPLPDRSISHTHDSFAPLINPTFSDISSATSLAYRLFNYNDKRVSNHLFILNIAGFSFSYIWLNDLYDERFKSIESIKTKFFKISKGFFYNNFIGFGLDYSFTKSINNEYDDYKSLSLGLLFRPFRYLSLGYVTRDLNKPRITEDTINRSEVYSISIKPLYENVAISLDAHRLAGEKFKKSDITVSADLRLLHDIAIFASSDKDKNINFGLTMPLGMRGSSIILDLYGSHHKEDAKNYSTFGVSISGEKHSTPILETKRLLGISLRDDINEIEAESFFRKNKPTFYDIINSIKNAREDDGIIGIILKIDKAALGFAQIQELRDELKNFSVSGKRVFAVLTTSGNKEYYLASASQKIYFTPSNSFSLTGLNAEVYFFKDLLEKVGIKFESVKRGKYKSFNEPFTRNKMSEEYRENIVSLLKDLNETYLIDIVKDRGISRERIEALFDKGIMSPEEAKRAGFIDVIAYPSDAEMSILKRYSLIASIVSLEKYLLEEKRNYQWGRIPGIAIIHVSGSIIRGKARTSGIPVNVIGDETYRQALEQAFGDHSIKAVIIRINSGGGSAVASDLMWNYLINMKKRYKKPVVFSFGNTAASGGYYVACTGDKIYGSKGTITGSIGVISGKLSLKDLYKKLGINKEVIKMSEFADIFSESKGLNEKEREVLQRGVDYFYEQFTQKVMQSRKIGSDLIPNVAEGRVFSGNQGVANDLIDSLGGIITSIEYAKSLVNIRGNYRVKHLPGKKVAMMELLGLKVKDRILPKHLSTVLKNIEGLQFDDESYLYYFPYRIVIK
ncbi:MAG: signal peptide peptidase SppA [Spirochaetota bacterium]|nr:signal peptide peptidase SppA [Spirochaetota bacterium]